MNPTYTIHFKDNTTGDESRPFTTDDDRVSLDRNVNHDITDVTLAIGHEYTVTVTDALDRTLSTTFVFGASMVKTDIATVHFRKPGTERSNNESQGGYIKINNDVTVLGVPYSAFSASDITIMRVVNGAEIEDPYTTDSYKDAQDTTWDVYYVSGNGDYNVYLKYLDADILIYTTTVTDNVDVNLFTSTNYLAYKEEYNPDNGDTYSNRVLSGLTDSDWHNGTPFRGNDAESWIMRHTYYRQNQNKNLAYNDMIYTNAGNRIAIFGQPEMGNLVSGGALYPSGTTYKNDYSKYPGYFLEESYSYWPTMYWDGHNENPNNPFPRNTFDAMSYTEDGRAAADASKVKITGYTYVEESGLTIFRYTDTDNALMSGHGCVVVLENGDKLFPVVGNGAMTATTSYDIYGNVTDYEQLMKLLSIATVYPTLEVPTMYKPFYGDVSAATWAVQQLVMDADTTGEMLPQKVDLPLSYKVEGDVYNGLTYNNRFYSGNTQGEYETYLIFNDSPDFYNALSAKTSEDYNPQRLCQFGHGSSASSFGREISAYTSAAKDIPNIVYAIKEGMPPSAGLNQRVFTERYGNGFDQMTLSDSCMLSDVFPQTIAIKVYDAMLGLSGDSSVFVGSFLPDENNTKYYIIKNLPSASKLFVDNGVMTVSDLGGVFARGFYNERSPHDAKGTITSVEVKNNKYNYTVTDDNGIKRPKNQPVSSTGEANVYDDGITLSHKFTLRAKYRKNIDSINAVLAASGQQITVSTYERTGYKFIGNDYEAVIAVYTRPDDGTMNQMVVYRLYALNSLDVLFAGAEEGVEPPEIENVTVTARFKQTLE
jgi:hypothetical protein